MKYCPDCKTDKPLAAFGPRAASPDGRARYCRDCFAARSRASYRRRQQRVGRVVREPRLVPEGKKWCPDCDTIKSLEDFCRNKRSRSGRATYCRDCHNSRCREVRDRLYGGGREYHLRRRYGIGQADVDRMLSAQGNSCAVCDKPDPEHVDHDHETGAVRGMLCFNCNQALGNARDDIEVLERLRSYLIVRRPDLIRRRGSEQLPLAGLAIELAADYAGCAGRR